MGKPIILVGGGGHSKSVIEAVESIGKEIKGIIDGNKTIGEKVLRYEIIGNEDAMQEFKEEAEFLISFGFIKDPKMRIRQYYRMKMMGLTFATVIASTAVVSKYAKIGEGSVVLHGAKINAGAVIGKNVIINTNAVVEHDTSIGDQCHISTGVAVNGGCTIGDNVFVGSNSCIANGISVCSNVVIGQGSNIYRNIYTAGIYVSRTRTQKIKS
jgi:sugar O-acyltransferase (sialic acid O-acetyltransferase NeuD family)